MTCHLCNDVAEAIRAQAEGLLGAFKADDVMRYLVSFQLKWLCLPPWHHCSSKTYELPLLLDDAVSSTTSKLEAPRNLLHRHIVIEQ